MLLADPVPEKPAPQPEQAAPFDPAPVPFLPSLPALILEQGTGERDLAEQEVGLLQGKVAKLEGDVTQLKAQNKSLNDTIDLQAFILQPPAPADASDWADFDY